MPCRPVPKRSSSASAIPSRLCENVRKISINKLLMNSSYKHKKVDDAECDHLRPAETALIYLKRLSIRNE
jgi:hypothetical protein